MHRIHLAGGLAVAALLALQGAALGAAPRDRVVGSVQSADLGGAASQLSVSAHSDGDGANARGTLVYHEVQGYTEQDAVAEVICLRVDGADAVILGRWRDPDPATWPF